MLGKLIKYDFRSCWKKFWPIWAGVIAVFVINGITLRISSDYNIYSFGIETLPKLVLFGMSAAALVIAIIYIYNEFAHGLLGHQGYLSFTLPATEEELIGSKAITALIMEAISGAVVILSIFLATLVNAPDYIVEMLRDISTWISECESAWLFIPFAIEGIVLSLVTGMTFNFHIYTAVSIGHLSGKHRRILGVITFVALCILSMTLIIRVALPLTERISDGCNRIGMSWQDDAGLIMLCMGIWILGELIYSAIMFFIIRFILKKHLNLD